MVPQVYELHIWMRIYIITNSRNIEWKANCVIIIQLYYNIIYDTTMKLSLNGNRMYFI